MPVTLQKSSSNLPNQQKNQIGQKIKISIGPFLKKCKGVEKKQIVFNLASNKPN